MMFSTIGILTPVVLFALLVAKPQWLMKHLQAPKEPEPLTPVEDLVKRYRILDEQDWEYQFRQLNKGKAWDYKPRPTSVRQPIRRSVDENGDVTEIHSWQYEVDGEVICNSCARHRHERCVVFDESVEDICFCGCLGDDDE